jgi:hypothetical protein
VAENELVNLNRVQERQKLMVENMEKIKMRQELFYE